MTLANVVVRGVRQTSKTVSGWVKVGDFISELGRNVATVASGVANAWVSNQFGGIGYVDANEAGYDYRDALLYRAGQTGGNPLSIAQGLSEVGIGGGGELASLGTASPLAIPLMAHGGLTAWSGTKNIINDALNPIQRGRVFMNSSPPRNKVPQKPSVNQANKAGGVNVPGRVQSRINITNKGWEHVLDRHFSNKNASQFTISKDELRTLLSSNEVVKTPINRTLESAGGIRYVREITLKKSIGLDKFNNYQPTSTMTILTDKYGNLVTTTPGLIK